ncbi:hypothetical protein [Crocosphaera chwakensis]|uniref:Uncharacterized protein n=1 Tax=Crocosphaera chwakensis CCY0110 TaxID=391612 RepID=A3IM71_9CHRO|nr:hypothetical protein [Crocosphaera chwakensis]EAZ92527.1 hypothetical protein CY0110_02339 [Crocosphaera chwakensis CCY0110]
MFLKKSNKHDKPDNNQHSLSVNIAKVLSLTLIVCVVGSIVLSIQDKPTPDLVTNLAQSSFATLTGMLITRL